MRVFCPNCSEPINISDDLAGKATVCPLCKAPFSAPALFTGESATPASIKTYSLAPTPPASASTASAAPPLSNSDMKVASAPTATIPPPPTTSYRSPSASAPPAPPNESETYTRRYGFSISPEAIQWTAPVCFGLAIFFTFFSWDGAYPGGHGVYTQGPYRATFGLIHTDNPGEQVVKLNPEKPAEGQKRLEDQVGWNVLLLLYLPLLYAAFGLSIFFTLLPKLAVKVPSNLKELLPWRMLAITGLSIVLIFFLSIVSLRGFGLENALRERVAIKEPLPANATDQDVLQREIKEGMALGEFNVRRSTAFELEFVTLILAGLGAAATWGMMRRSDKPHPRLEVMW